ncbi:hypothetical protein OAB47_04020 [Vicingaceae bacterium]|nr:hypothetical protein [Vicingaceae bacterium]
MQAGLRQSSYIVDTREGCCGDEKVGKYGDTNLLHATDNKSSLVDEFLKFTNKKSDVETTINTLKKLPKFKLRK